MKRQFKLNIFWMFIITCMLSISCYKKQSYDCEVVHHTGIGAGVNITVQKKFKGTHKQMLKFEKKNTNENKTTNCY